VIADAWSRGDKLGLAGIGIGVIGVAVSSIGFLLAYIQLKRTANATVASAAALKAAGETQILMLLPQFQLREMELDYAIEDSKREMAARSLVAYAHLAQETSVVIQAQGLGSAELIENMRLCARKARDAKSEIYSHKVKKLDTITRDFREHSQHLAEMMSDLRATLTPSGASAPHA
jgi:hypothetical protein